jgi:hypothetical protein
MWSGLVFIPLRGYGVDTIADLRNTGAAVTVPDVIFVLDRPHADVLHAFGDKSARPAPIRHLRLGVRPKAPPAKGLTQPRRSIPEQPCGS